jgi:UDP-N-acetylglucosamine--dolichyl-phosphate N-acetylglucosaminephosphotransferase
MNLWIRKAHQIGLVWKDMHKMGERMVAGSGGIIVSLAFIIGVLIYVAIKVFYFKDENNLIQILSLTSSILIIAGVGFVDDLFGWQHGGLSMKNRIILAVFAAIPLMVINAGTSEMMGIEFGLIYPLFFIPLGIVGASTTFNFLAGYNGLEAGQGILIIGALSIVTYLTGTKWLSLLCLIMLISLIGFYIFNRNPARVFPGDVLTYSLGAFIAIVAILGNIEKFAIFIFIPYIIEVILKVRGKLKKASLAKLNNRGYLEMPYEKFYGLEHISIYLNKKLKKNVRENDVVLLINIFQIAIIIIGFIIFRGSIF